MEVKLELSFSTLLQQGSHNLCPKDSGLGEETACWLLASCAPFHHLKFSKET